MCSYNKINGTYASDNEYLLNKILRKEWGYEGLVMSDWGATDDRVLGIKAGMDLEMPGASPDNDAEIVAAVKKGTLSEEDLNKSALRITELILRGQDEKPEPEHVDVDHNAIAKEISYNSAVLLKNENAILPLSTGSKIAVIGEMAKKPRYQGAGSSRICPAFLDNAYDALSEAGANITYAEGYSLNSHDVDQAKIEEACKVAKACDVAVVFAGLPDEYESEGFDRDTLTMPESHNKLIQAVAKANPNTIVVLQLGAAVVMPWKDQVKGILLMYLAGQAGGGATADLLLGKVNPSGKLAETFPLALEDNSSTAYFPGEPKAVQYRESIYVGYRYYDVSGVEVAYPFGYGLSYTNFEYSDVQISQKDKYSFAVTAKITNTGTKAGAEAAQLYVQCKQSAIFRAKKELKAFDKVFLQPGESKTVRFELDKRSFAYYNTKVSDWCVEEGDYDILVASSSADIRLTGSVSLEGDGKEALLKPVYDTLTEYQKPSKPFRISDTQFEKLLGYKPPVGHMLPGEPFTINSTVGDIKDTFIGKTMLKVSRKQMSKMIGDDPDPTMLRLVERSMMDMPLRGIKMATSMNNKKIEGIADFANGKFFKGICKFLSK
jgi:beta-glucosidase